MQKNLNLIIRKANKDTLKIEPIFQFSLQVRKVYLIILIHCKLSSFLTILSRCCFKMELSFRIVTQKCLLLNNELFSVYLFVTFLFSEQKILSRNYFHPYKHVHLIHTVYTLALDARSLCAFTAALTAGELPSPVPILSVAADFSYVGPRDPL